MKSRPVAPVATLIVGPPGEDRAHRIADWLRQGPSGQPVSLLLEGAPLKGAEVEPLPGRYVHVLAPACLCCLGHLTLRVTLARVLQHEAPTRLLLALADPQHRLRMITMLGSPPWNDWLDLRTEQVEA